MITIGALSARRIAVVRAVLLTTVLLGAWAMPVAAASVSGTKTVSGTFTPGGSIVYTVILTNAGPGGQLDNPSHEFTDTLPPEVTLVSANATSGTPNAVVAANAVSWNGPLGVGVSVTITINATIVASTALATSVENQGLVSFDADGDGDNESTVVTDDPGVGGAGPHQLHRLILSGDHYGDQNGGRPVSTRESHYLHGHPHQYGTQHAVR